MTPLHRRTIVAIIVLSSPAGALVAGSTASASPRSSCAARVASAARATDAGGRFVRVARSGSIEVFSPKGAGFGAFHYVCRSRTGALHRFARNSGGAADRDVVTSSIVARGSEVAYRTSVRGDGHGSERFVVRSGLTGEVLTDTGALRSTETGPPRTDQLVLLPHATIAWATRDAGVHVTDGDADHVLAAPDGATPTRLRATATTLSWTENGRRVSARLP
jgi:hypothetical protein